MQGYARLTQYVRSHVMPRRTKSKELLDFEIQFYEQLLRASPDFIDVLLPLGNAYTRRGLYEKGLAVDLRLTQLRGTDPLSWYNLACSYALLSRIEESIEALRRAFQLGYTDLRHLQSDPDLAPLRRSAKYLQLLESVATLAASRLPQAGAAPSA